MATNRTFYIWATLLSDRASSELVSGLVRNGFHVGPLANTNNLTIVGSVSTLCSIKAVADHVPEPTEKSTTQGWVLERVKHVLDENKNMYLSVIVYEVGGSCTWQGGNVPRKEDDPPPAKEPQPPTVLDTMDKKLGD